jgi:hypothetical protein
MGEFDQNVYPGANVNNSNKTVSLNNYSANMEIQYANNYHIQNEMLQKFKDMQSTNTSKVNNLLVQTYNLNWYNWILVLIYGGLVLVFVVFVFVGKKMGNWPFILKIIVCLILGLFPFFITFIEQLLMKLFSYIMNFINGSVYISPSF